MTATCSLSGETIEVAVASKKSGRLFEERVIAAYIEENGKDPISNESMTIDDLLPVTLDKLATTRTPSATSIPALLTMFQNEWDASMLETFELKKQYATIRQELANALYQQDAACRVIARLIKERDEARAALNNLDPSTVRNGGQTKSTNGETQDVAMAEEEEQEVSAAAAYTLSSETIDIINDTFTSLSATRRKRKAPADLNTVEQVKAWTEPATHFATPFAKAHPEINTMALSQLNPDLLAVASMSNIKIISKTSGETLASLQGKGSQTKLITSLAFVPEQHMLLSASADKTIKVWTADSEEASAKWSPTDTLTGHTDTVTSVAIHPSGEMALSTSLDGTWRLHSIASVFTVDAVDAQVGPLTKGALHPDGVLFAVGGENGKIVLYDIKEGTLAATFEGHTSAITAMTFSENGYILASAAGTENARVWDLRKLSCVKEIETDGRETNAITFDQSGQYCVFAGDYLSVYQSKGWQLLTTTSTEDVTGALFGDALAKTLITASAKRGLHVYSS